MLRLHAVPVHERRRHPPGDGQPAGTNSGSLKTYYFAHLHGLDEAATLRLFCEHYKDVLDTLDGDSHANIRAFMVNGWDGIKFEGELLKLRHGTEVDDVDLV